MAYLEHQLQKLNGLPAIAHRSLRQIRELDQKVNNIEKQLEGMQKNFIDRLASSSKSKRDARQKEQLDHSYKQILKLHDASSRLSQEKVKIADELYNVLHQPTERLDIDLKRMRNEFKDDQRYKDIKSKKARVLKKKAKKGQEQVQLIPPPPANQPRYCYCGRPSFGQMVECENSLCENEWFHLSCIDDKPLPDKWYCLDCRKTKKANKAAKKTARISKPKKKIKKNITKNSKSAATRNKSKNLKSK